MQPTTSYEDLTEEKIEALRRFACEIIQHAGILLKLPQTAMATAQMLLQRVYSTIDYTFNKYPLDITALASLFLAAKVEDTPRNARDMIAIFASVMQSKFDEKVTLTNEQQEDIREQIIVTERRILKNLGFNLLSDYPHKIIVTNYHAMVNALDEDKNVWQHHINQEILQIAWNYCNDSLRSDVFLKLSKEAVACACIQMACEDIQMFFPTSTDGKEWYSLFANDADVREAIRIIDRLYKTPPPIAYQLRSYIYFTKYIRNRRSMAHDSSQYERNHL